MPQKRLTQIARRFIAHDEFNKFKLLVTNDEERKNAHIDLAKELKTLERKISEISQGGTNMESDISEMRRELRKKATQTRLEQVEIHLLDYATKDDLRRLRSAQESYTPLESFNKSRLAQDHINNDLDNKLSSLVTKAQLKDDLVESRLWFETLNAENSQKRDCLKDRKQIES